MNEKAAIKTAPLVSIIVPVYNRETLVARVIATVVKQGYQNWELLLIDDASTDNTKQVITEYAKSDQRIRCIDNTHKKGPSGGRNTGLDHAKGKYIAYQDSDDEWVDYHLETMVHYLETYPDQIDLMTADPLRKYEETGEVFNYDKMDMSTIAHTKLEEGYLIDRSELFDKQLRGRVVTTQCLVGKAELMKSVRWNEDLNAAVDIMHNLELCAEDISVCHISDYLAVYWAHDDNLTNVSGGHSPERMERVHKAFALYWEMVLKKMILNKNQKGYVKSNLAQCYAWHLAYHTYEPQDKFKLAFLNYIKAIKNNPKNISYYIGLLKLLAKIVLGFKA